MTRELPQTFNTFPEARKQGFMRVKAIKEQGGKVAGTFCTYTPVEILDAAGVIPVSLCGMSQDPIPAAEAHLPKNLCPLVKSSYGFALSDSCPYTYFADLIVGETTCDSKKKMYELLNRIKQTYILRLPQSQAEDTALDQWTLEMRRFIAFLEEKFNVTITDEALRQASRVRNEERRAKLDLMELQKLTPPPMTGYDLYKTLDGTGFKFDRRQVIDELNALSTDIRQKYDDGHRPISADAKRILITGCPIGGVLEKTVKLIEEKNGIVVCFENCTGIKAVFQMIDTEAEDIVREIAARYLQIGCSVMTPNPNRFALLGRLLDEYAIDGVVEVDLQACTPYCIESHFIRAYCKEHNMPYTAIETDYSQADVGQLATRLEAFIETL